MESKKVITYIHTFIKTNSKVRRKILLFDSIKLAKWVAKKTLTMLANSK